MALRFDIISIGALARNRLWNETAPARTGHATTTLIRTRDRHILVDPALPASIIGARLRERTGLKPEQIDTIFLTTFHPTHRAGLDAFPKAKVLIHETEKQHFHAYLQRLLNQTDSAEEGRPVMQQELALLERIQEAEDKLAPQVDLFPLPGFTAGTCGLLLSQPTLTALITGPAIASQDHFMAMQILPDAQDLEKAKESMSEIYEIADLIVPGYDNLFINPRTQGM